MDDLVFGDLRISAAPAAADTLVLEWRGKSVDRQPGKVLDPYLTTAVREAADGKKVLEMRFGGLEHFNSSTITSLIAVVQSARAAAVRLVLVYDKSLKWQKLSFDALRVLGKADGLLEIRAL